MSLRRRLFFFVFVPVGLLYIAFGVFGALQTRGDLIADLDDELRLDSRNSADLIEAIEPEVLAEILTDLASGGTADLQAVISARSGDVFVNPAQRYGEILPAPASADLGLEKLVNLLDQPFTVESADGELRYRAMATRIDGGRLVVTGKPLDRIDRLTRRFIGGTLVTSLFLLAAMAAVVYVAVQSGLKPLRAFVETTGRVAEGDLSERLSPDQGEPAFDKMATSTNHMLDRIEASYEQQRIGRERLNDLIADAAHELRTPLAGIRGTVEMRSMGMLDDDNRLATAFDGIDQQSARMADIVEDLIVIARAENLRISAQGTPASIVDIGVLVAQKVKALKAKHNTREIDFIVTGTELEVAGDDGLLSTAVDHVLDNAIKHTGDEATVSVLVAAKDTSVRIEIVDTGDGVPLELGDRVFDRFVRGDNSRARSSGGNGLGLTIAQSIVASAGGAIELDSVAGEGSTFTLVFPQFKRSGRLKTL